MFKIGKSGEMHSAKRDAETKVDISVYQAAQSHFTVRTHRITSAKVRKSYNYLALVFKIIQTVQCPITRTFTIY
jgi:hypothetical protein